MAKSKKKKRDRRGGAFRTRVLLGVLLGTLSILLAVAMAAYLDQGHWRSDPGALAARMGRLSYLAASTTIGWLGVPGGWLVPLALGAFALRLLSGGRWPGPGRRSLAIAGVASLLASSFAALLAPGRSDAWRLFAGGIGAGAVSVLHALFGGAGAAVVLGGAGLAFLAAVGVPVLAPLVALRDPLIGLSERIGELVGAASERGRASLDHLREAIRVETPDRGGRRGRRGRSGGDEPVARGSLREVEEDGAEVLVLRGGGRAEDEEDEDAWEGGAAPGVEIAAPSRRAPAAARDEDEENGEEAPDEDGLTEIPADVPVLVLPSAGEPPPRPRPVADDAGPVESLADLPRQTTEPYVAPPRNFLEQEEDDPDEERHREELLESARLLERTLRDFGVKGKVTQVQPGPVITRYEIEPAAGQKVAPIAGLSDDLALALRARSIRVVAPIPGKAAVGIEVPNARPQVVRLGSLLETPEYRDEASPLNIALGRTISGEAYCAPLDRMPHVLVAGATGSGKSVCINTIITSIIYRAGPEDVRFVMVDPKMLELMTYVGLPHVIPPVVTQPKEAAKILKWAVGEMEARYRTLAHVGVRSIADYNRRQEREGAQRMPYLVVIVDELADLMLSNVKSEIEESIARLAQMARAVGIHLVVATQRPSVDVITGVIKANFPSRIAFQVPTRTDSRTILDAIGAEKLLGKGDMLYLGVGMAQPVRVHGSFISTEETNDVVEWLKARNPQALGPDGRETEPPSPLDGDDDLFPREREDDLFEEASRILVAHQQGSISLLQRRLKVGYARAARLVDMMEEAGIVGPFTGSKAREILVPTVDELERKLAGRRQAPLGG